MDKNERLSAERINAILGIVEEFNALQDEEYRDSFLAVTLLESQFDTKTLAQMRKTLYNENTR